MIPRRPGQRRILARDTDIPVPPIRWYEPDSAYLGAPFFVMERIAGRVPTDMPPYHTGGWVTEIAPDERRTMWWAALEILARLKAHRPAEEHPPVLLWGDARIGNVIFGQPEEDLAWYLYLDRHHSEGVYADRLDGFPTSTETIARFEELLGRPVRDMRFYEVLSGFKFTVIMSRIGQAMIEWDWLEGDSDFPYNNNASRLLDTILEGLS